MATIIYTLTDEAPMLATYSFLPIVQAFASSAGVDVETRDISLAGRILALFPEHLTEEQRISDALAELGALATTPEANIIKLPNVSASMPQLKAAIAELQSQGYALPDYPDDPQTDEERRSPRATTRSRAARSTRCCARATPTAAPRSAVKNYARKHPHSMGAWSPDSKTNVAHHGRRRLPRQREVRRARRRRHPHHPARGRRRHHHRAQGRPARCSRARSSTPP